MLHMLSRPVEYEDGEFGAPHVSENLMPRLVWFVQCLFSRKSQTKSLIRLLEGAIALSVFLGIPRHPDGRRAFAKVIDPTLTLDSTNSQSHPIM